MPHTKPTLSPPKPPSSVGARSPRPYGRSIAIGLILIPLNCYWITYIELVQYSAQPTIVSLIFTVVFNILVLIGFNQIFRRFLPRLALSQGELLVIYVMLSVASATAGHSMMEILVSTLGHAFWFATPENDWKDLFWRYIPNWLAVVDKDVLSGYYEGDSTLHTKQHLLGWLTPVMSWFGFLFAMLFVMVCLTLIVRKPWRNLQNWLTYPLDPDYWALGFTGIGLLFALFLMLMRMKFSGSLSIRLGTRGRLCCCPRHSRVRGHSARRCCAKIPVWIESPRCLKNYNRSRGAYEPF